MPAPNPPGDKPNREDRLAAKLRENLRRRKAQARALSTGESGDEAAAASPAGDIAAPALPKSPPES